MQRAIPRLAALLCAAALLAPTACGGPASPADPGPPGALLVARTADLARLLERLARLEGTPLGRRAAALAAALPDCPTVEAQAPGGGLAELWASLRCTPAHSELAALDAERGDAALAFAWPLEPGVRVRGRLALDAADDADVELRVPTAAATGLAGMLLPGQEPGPGVLSGADALLHARLRPAGGLDLAALVPEGGQGDQMFQLKSELFAGAVLDGTWEAAIYLPEPGATTPRAALALGFRSRGPAVAAAERFLADLRKTWPVARAPFRAGPDADGACLPDLRILPDFAPCYVATAHALVVGWNPPSVRKALDGGDAGLGQGGGLLIDLERFGEADARLAAALGGPPSPSVPPPWDRLRVDGGAGQDAVHVRLRLEAGEGA